METRSKSKKEKSRRINKSNTSDEKGIDQQPQTGEPSGICIVSSNKSESMNKSEKSHRSKRSDSIKRLQLEAQAAEALAKIEEEEAELEAQSKKAQAEAARQAAEAQAEAARQAAEAENVAQKKKLEARKRVLQKKLELEIELSSRCSSRLSERSKIGVEDPNEKVRNWLDSKQAAAQERHGEGNKYKISVAPKLEQVEVSNWLENDFQPNGNLNCKSEGGVRCKNQTCNTLKELPPFYGDVKEWPLFIAEYKRTTQSGHYSNLDNLQRLQKAIRGRARQVVHSLLIYPENVPDIILSLERRFGRPELIIESLTDKIRSVAPPKEYRIESLIEFSDMVRNLVAMIKGLEYYHYLQNPQLLGELVAKLSPNLKLKWGEFITSVGSKFISLDHFAEWIGIIGDSANAVAPHHFLDKTDNSFRRDGKRDTALNITTTVAANDQVEENKLKFCKLCNKETHKLAKCKKFCEMSVDERWDFIKNNRICFSCLIYGHLIKRCKIKAICKEEGCTKVHHPLLHNNKFPMTAKVNLTANTMQSILLRVVPITVIGDKKEIQTFALFDEGSTTTLIDSDLADRIGARGKSSPFKMYWATEQSHEEDDSRLVEFKIKGQDGHSFIIKNARTISKLNLPLQTLDMKKIKRTWKHLSHVPVVNMNNVQPLLLIGQDNINLTIPREVREGPGNAPIASLSKLGWVVHGRTSMYKGRSDCNVIVSREIEEDTLHRLVKEYFEKDYIDSEVSTTKPMSEEDKIALEIMNRTCRLTKENRWEIGLLWRDQDPVMPESRAMALKRLFSVERKMDVNQKLADNYCAQIETYLRDDYARNLTEGEAKIETNKTYYLPHFSVTHPQKLDKFRFVFDAAAKCRGTSLNDKLLTGPDLLNSITDILFKFRLHKIAFSADIKDMFLRVKIREEDQMALRFLWRGKNRKISPMVYQMTSMIFGAACSPSCAIFVTRRNAEEHKVEFPHVFKAVSELLYMDDYLDGRNSEKEAVKQIQDMIEVHKRGGFQICKWICSSLEVLKAIPEEYRSPSVKNFESAELPVERVLGVRWDPNKDCFLFRLNLSKFEEEVFTKKRCPTKREMLTMVMSMFDPLGFIAPLTMKGKILLQETWKNNIMWDGSLPESMKKDCAEWMGEVSQINKIEIPRHYSNMLNGRTRVELHVFCDASEQGYAAVAYFRVKDSQGRVEVAFILAKTRVASLSKAISIPRMELQAAVLGARVAVMVVKGHQLSIDEKYIWTDSSIVWSWIQSTTNKFKVYVANRITEIRRHTKQEEWRWVPTSVNTADLATRKGKIVDLKRWFAGPEFLLLDENSWPKNNFKVDPDLGKNELKKEFTMVVIADDEMVLPDISRFSKYLRLVRATAWFIRSVKYWKNKIEKRSDLKVEEGNLTPDEVTYAERLWIKRVQREGFLEEIQVVEDGKTVKKSSRLFRLTPTIDEEGVLRIRGRIDKSPDVSVQTKRPAILEPKHRFTRLLVEYYHNLLGHQGREMVSNELRQRFWILKMKALVKRVGNDCLDCQRRRGKPEIPEMAPLPEYRVTKYTRPFTVTGVDYFGPMEVTVGRRREKRYGVIFVCMSVRAVHVELAASLTTDSAILAIRRMMARRGCPNKFVSDNGTNLRGAEKELRAEVKKLEQSKIAEFVSGKGIEWSFNPPLAPHMGGAWERLIKSIKAALKVVLKERTPREETLLTLLTEVEHIVNCRPLTEVSLDQVDEESLTPNHFLLGSSSNVPLPGEFRKEDLNLRKQWRIAQALADMFWRRWVKEYLPQLLNRSKWLKDGGQEPVKKDDLVIVVDELMPRNVWPRGRVTKVYPGSDGKVRVVEVQTTVGTLKRPVTKIVKLGTD